MGEIKEVNETMVYQLGSLRDRFVAFLIDFGPMFVLSLMSDGVGWLAEICVILLLIWMGFDFILIPWRYKGMTLGKKIFGLKVIPFSSFTTGVDFDLPLTLFVLREILIIPFFGFLNPIIILNSKNKRGLHDFIVGSVVVTEKPGSLSVNEYINKRQQVKEQGNIILPPDQTSTAAEKISSKQMGKQANRISTYKNKFLKVVRQEAACFRCPECDSDLRKGQKYCSNCGAEVDWEN
jgi:uncharacterized RDD family membrane protein YckC